MRAPRRVVLGIRAGVALYKCCDLVRRLREREFQVDVVMSRAACDLVRPLLFEALSSRPVVTDPFDPGKGGGMDHIALARDASAILVAPATANVIGKLAAGVADDLLTTLVLASEAPVILAPAMNSVMWRQSIVQENLTRLAARGFRIVPPGSGDLACGETGPGRLAEVAAIVAEVMSVAVKGQSLAGCRILVNGGPTREPIDAVRFLSNPSSGRMGIELARVARDRGASVSLVLGPTQLEPPTGVRRLRVKTASEMMRVCLDEAKGMDAAVLSAAVADVAPVMLGVGKTKKDAMPDTLRLARTEDVLKAVAATARPVVLVGFAAECGEASAEAERKRREKGCDFMVGNDVSSSGVGFESPRIRPIFVFRDGRREDLGELSKRDLAELIWDRVADLLPGGEPREARESEEDES